MRVSVPDRLVITAALHWVPQTPGGAGARAVSCSSSQHCHGGRKSSWVSPGLMGFAPSEDTEEGPSRLSSPQWLLASLADTSLQSLLHCHMACPCVPVHVAALYRQQSLDLEPTQIQYDLITPAKT